uniref:TonB C-terminal domain-containing protein n=1 Tax=Magnetospirillum gryphiswaldense TaxID=55518 RepID=A4TV79_9PROT|nr:hypothetical protein MGR_0101 [Magnetospirillum gryphiswaldense MSR-1]
MGVGHLPRRALPPGGGVGWGCGGAEAHNTWEGWLRPPRPRGGGGGDLYGGVLSKRGLENFSPGRLFFPRGGGGGSVFFGVFFGAAPGLFFLGGARGGPKIFLPFPEGGGGGFGLRVFFCPSKAGGGKFDSPSPRAGAGAGFCQWPAGGFVFWGIRCFLAWPLGGPGARLPLGPKLVGRAKPPGKLLGQWKFQFFARERPPQPPFLRGPPLSPPEAPGCPSAGDPRGPKLSPFPAGGGVAPAAPSGGLRSPPSRVVGGAPQKVGGRAAGDGVAETVAGQAGVPFGAPGYHLGAVETPAPDYFFAARKRRRQGIVLVQLDVGADGRVDRVVLLESSGDSTLDEAAMTTLGRWRLRPATENNRPVPGRVEVPVRFRLE